MDLTLRTREAPQREALFGRVDANRALASRLGATGAPTYIIGDQRVVGYQPFEQLASAMASARKGTQASGAFCT